MKRDLQQRIAEKEIELKQKHAQLQKLRAQEAAEERKKDTRRKILAGAVVLTKAANDPAFADQLRAWLNRSLSADRDRDLFDLPSHRPEATTEA